MDQITAKIKTRRCVGCGTCAGFCPTRAIRMVIDRKKGVYRPVRDTKKCTDCGACCEVCPVFRPDLEDLNFKLFGKKQRDILLGNYLNCYAGYSTDHQIRFDSSSGGLITQLLIFSLEEGLINGALVTRMRTDKPLEPEPFIARDRKEVIEASKSKYCPVPANTVLEEILHSKKGEKFAVVGLPCDICGIRKAENLSKKLRERVVLHFGLFCDHSPSFLATEFRIRQMNIRKEEVKKIDYRGEGWPGKMSITTLDNTRKTVHFWNPIFSYYYYSPGCLLCPDATSELSDISFGDAWLPEFRNSDSIGTSICISRTDSGEELLHNAISKEKVELTRISRGKAIEAQKELLCFKKKTLNAYVKILNLLHENVSCGTQLMDPSWIDYVVALIYHMNTYTVSGSALLSSLLKNKRILDCCSRTTSLLSALSLRDFRKKVRRAKTTHL